MNDGVRETTTRGQTRSWLYYAQNTTTLGTTTKHLHSMYILLLLLYILRYYSTISSLQKKQDNTIFRWGGFQIHVGKGSGSLQR